MPLFSFSLEEVLGCKSQTPICADRPCSKCDIRHPLCLYEVSHYFRLYYFCIKFLGIIVNRGQKYLSYLSSSFHQKRPGRDCVLASAPPPGGELTAQDEGDACHTMAPRAMTHSLSVHPPAPCLTCSLGPRCYTFAMKRDRPGVFAALIRCCSFTRCRLERNVTHAGKNRSLCNARAKAWMRVWLHRSMWLWPGHCSIGTTIASQTRPGSRRNWLLLQQTSWESMSLRAPRFMVQMASRGYYSFSS